MTIRAASPVTPFWWSPEAPNDENPATDLTAFHIRALTGLEYFDANSEMKHSDGYILTTSMGVRRILGPGLLNWRNLKDPSTNADVAFDKNDLEANVRQLTANTLQAVCTRIMEASRLSSFAKKD